MSLTSSLSILAARFLPIRRYASALWRHYRGLSRKLQVVVAVLVVGIVFGGAYALAHKGTPQTEAPTFPTVVLKPVSDLSGTSSSVAVIGSVRSVTSADILAQTSGTVIGVRTKLGSSVPAGFVIVELENASQRAAVLQAEGSYDAAIAARMGSSPEDIAASARNTYATSYSTLDTLLKLDIDQFYGEPLSLGPQFIISPAPFDASYFQVKRRLMNDTMNAWREHLKTASTSDPNTLLDEADAAVHQATALVNDIAQAATKSDTDATETQLSALSTGRTGITTLQASITAAKQTYQGQSTSATAGVDASVKIALGSLRAAQAQLEKTLIRTPISGTVNFLPVRPGDYVTALMHVATVAQNGALEIVAYVSEDVRALLSVGASVTVEDMYPGVITSIAPALDPVTKQIEVHVAVTGTSSLVNGQSVRISVPSATAPTSAAAGPILLPLTALKLTPSSRVVFSVGEDARLIAHTVEIGDVHGDRIEITSALPSDLRIVTDARGLSEGQKVTIAEGS